MNLRKADLCYLFLIVFIIAALPFGISAYDRYVWSKKIPMETKVFHLTGHTEKGWILGGINASDVLMDNLIPKKHTLPVVRVRKGDTVVLKLTSSDVVHGFSLKGFGIFINDGIHPGKPITVSFVADRSGTFTFACNAICGSHHENMFGTIIVTA
jgi:heme/copper-type cytochrome/quinol oxidase subunit 2